MLRRSFLRLSALLSSGIVLLGVSALHAADAPAKSIIEIPKWGRWQDPDKDCQYKLDKGNLVITVPGWEHDLSMDRVKMNAPVVLQDTKDDFGVQVKISGDFKPGGPVAINSPAYVGAGLVVMLDNRNYVRLERAAYIKPNTTQVIHIMSFEIRINGAIQRFGAAQDNRVDGKTPLYFRIERHGKKIYGAVSQDGEEWQVLDVKTLSAEPKMSAGVFAVNLTSEEFKPKFEDFKLEELDPVEEETPSTTGAPDPTKPPVPLTLPKTRKRR